MSTNNEATPLWQPKGGFDLATGKANDGTTYQDFLNNQNKGYSFSLTNPATGVSAAAARYIEVRLTPFALDVLYNKKITTWSSSYDGRSKEPQTLPVKFPLLLVCEFSEGPE